MEAGNIRQTGQRTERNDARRWWLVVAALALVGLVVRVAFVFYYENPSPLAGDAGYYHQVANLIASGRGFVDPYLGGADATHPPLYTLSLSAVSVLGLRTVLDHQLWSCVMGAVMVPVVALTGRELVDDVTGLVAGALAAIYPGFWINDGLLMSETLVALLMAVLVLFVYRTIRRPTIAHAIVVGALCGLAALTRGELVLLPVVLVVPLVWSLYRRIGARALTLGVVMLALMAVVMTPWFAYNLGRFDRPVLVSTQGGQTLAGANCPYTYSEPSYIGLWTYPCVLFNRPTRAERQAGGGQDASALDGEYRSNALDYARAHETRVPAIVLARVGRVLGVYRPNQQLNTESRGADGRPYRPGLAGLLVYYVTGIAAAFGLVMFHRRGVPAWPVLGLAVMVVGTAAVTYGATRFRLPLEVALMVPAVLAFVRATELVRARLSNRAAGSPSSGSAASASIH